ncbi:MAG: alpha/beta hydrolase family protein [Capsulimonadaceae bacterium]
MTTTHLIKAGVSGRLSYLAIEPVVDAAGAPLVICLHGLRSAKENTLPTAYRFALAGFRTVSIDLRMHGDRAGAAGRDASLSQDYFTTMLEIIRGSVEDIRSLLDSGNESRAAIYGLSLGGIVAFASLAADPRLRVAMIAMGSPDFVGMAMAGGLTPDSPLYAEVKAASPLENPELLAGRPLLMLHGEEDSVVPVHGVVAFERALRPLYAGFPDRLELVLYPGHGHVHTDDMTARSVAWASRFAGAGDSGQTT